jgi:hypothetical protein
MEATPAQRRHSVLSDISNHQQQGAAAAAACHNNSSKQPRRAATAPALVITPSGYRGAAAKQEVQQLSSLIDAAYSPELVQGHTTHLVSSIHVVGVC